MLALAAAIVIGISGKGEYIPPQYTQNLYARRQQLNEETPP